MRDKAQIKLGSVERVDVKSSHNLKNKGAREREASVVCVNEQQDSIKLLQPKKGNSELADIIRKDMSIAL